MLQRPLDAAQNGDTAAAHQLVTDQGADMRSKNELRYGAGCMTGQLASGRSPEGLGFADCLRGNGACAWLRRWTALHLASQEGHTKKAKALVAAGADVHCKDNDGYGAGRCIAGLLESGPMAECRR